MRSQKLKEENISGSVVGSFWWIYNWNDSTSGLASVSGVGRSQMRADFHNKLAIYVCVCVCVCVCFILYIGFFFLNRWKLMLRWVKQLFYLVTKDLTADLESQRVPFPFCWVMFQLYDSRYTGRSLEGTVKLASHREKFGRIHQVSISFQEPARYDLLSALAPEGKRWVKAFPPKGKKIT